MLKKAPQFHDFVRSQHAWLRSDDCRQSVEYWRQQWIQFGDSQLRYEDLSFTARRTEVSLFTGVRTCTISSDFARAIRECARGLRVTPFMLILTAFYIFLATALRNRKIPLWLNFANRGGEGNKAAVGWFANTHLVGVDLSGSFNWQEVTRRVRNAVLNGLAHEQIPLAHLRYSLQAPFALLAPAIQVDLIPNQIATLGMWTQEWMVLKSGIISNKAFRPDFHLYVHERTEDILLSVTHSLRDFTTDGAKSALNAVCEILTQAISGADPPLHKQ